MKTKKMVFVKDFTGHAAYPLQEKPWLCVLVEAEPGLETGAVKDIEMFATREEADDYAKSKTVVLS